MVRKIRKKLGLSQSALAAKCQLAKWDISREGIAKIELGYRGVSDKEVVKLKEVLSLHSSDILLGDEAMKELEKIDEKES